MATNDRGEAPRAVIHKRILDSAAAEPDASLEALAGEIPGASPDLVERVLERYGDPGEPATADQPEEPPMPDPAQPTTDVELSRNQREALEAIARSPEATQSELAEALGCSRATVNKRLNAIPGFDWSDRVAFVERVLPDAPPADAEAAAAPAASAAVDGGRLLAPDAEHAVEQLQERVARLEQRIEQEPAGPAIDDALLAKVLRAVIADEGITEEEEVAVIEALR